MIGKARQSRAEVLKRVSDGRISSESVLTGRGASDFGFVGHESHMNIALIERSGNEKRKHQPVLPAGCGRGVPDGTFGTTENLSLRRRIDANFL